MSFLRSPAGISNLHIFLKADTVVYVEGGRRSYSAEDVLLGKFGTESIDILFWQNLFLTFSKGVKVAVRCCGSKTTAHAIAAKIVSGEVINVCIALDRDLDNWMGTRISSPLVFYTYGYSWENDALHATVLCDMFYALCPVPRDHTDVAAEVLASLSSFADAIYPAVCADIILAHSGSSLLPRDNPESVILVGSDKHPVINVERIQCLLSEAEKAGHDLAASKIAPSSLVDCYGALLASFCYRLLLYLCHRHSHISRFSKDVFAAMAIDKFANRLRAGELDPLYSHYRDQLGSL